MITIHKRGGKFQKELYLSQEVILEREYNKVNKQSNKQPFPRYLIKNRLSKGNKEVCLPVAVFSMFNLQTYETRFCE